MKRVFKMPPETRDAKFLDDFYEMKTEIKLINQRLEECSRAKGMCAEHHDFVTTQNASAGTLQSIIIKTSALTGIITGLLTLLFKLFKVF